MLVMLKDVETGTFINHAPQLAVPQLIALSSCSTAQSCLKKHEPDALPLTWTVESTSKDFRETSNDRQPTGATSKPLIKRRAPMQSHAAGTHTYTPTP